MHKYLSCKDRKYNQRKGVLQILGETMRKSSPIQKDFKGAEIPPTSSSPVWRESISKWWQSHVPEKRRLSSLWQYVHVINVDMEGTLEAATLGALILCELCQGLQQAEDMESSLAELLQEAKEKTGRCFLHMICFCWRSWLVSAPLLVRTCAWIFGQVSTFCEKHLQSPFH